MDTSVSNFREMVKDREAWHAAVHGSQRVRHNLATEQQKHIPLSVTYDSDISWFTH